MRNWPTPALRAGLPEGEATGSLTLTRFNSELLVNCEPGIVTVNRGACGIGCASVCALAHSERLPARIADRR